MNENPYESPESEDKAAAPTEGSGRSWGHRLVEVLVVVAVIGVLVALLLPNVRFAREAARRASCSNNLKQIVLALRNYADDYGVLPPAYTVDEAGKPLHSWRTLILPYVEEQALYAKIDLSKPWDDPANSEAFSTTLEAYRCPSANSPPQRTTYLAVVTEGGCLQPAQPRKLSEITDGPAYTMMLVESPPDDHVHWMSPVDADEDDILAFRSAELLSHPGGFQAAFVDRSTRFLSSEVSAEILSAMISIAGRDDEALESAE